MDRLITVVGGSGFIGRNVVQELVKRGERIRVVVRDVQRASFLLPLGGVGQIQLVSADVRDARAMEAAMRHAYGAVNLVGVLAEQGGVSFDAIHRQGAETAARSAAQAGVEAFVHISANGADPQSPSAYARTKAAGEVAVRAAVPRATILRPSVVFGPDDNFINRFAALARRLPIMPVIAGSTRLQPVYVGDVARAIVEAIEDPARFGGHIYELGGPKIYTMRELISWIMEQIYVHKPINEVPPGMAQLLARLGDILPFAPITSDQWLMLQRDNVVSSSAEGLEAFGITPTPLEAIAPAYLVRYRKRGRFNTGDQDRHAERAQETGRRR